MKKTDYQKLDDIEKVRRFIIYHPSATNVEIRRETNFSFDYIQKIRKEINKERARRLLREDNKKLLTAIGEFEDIYDEINNNLWQMLNKGTQFDRTKSEPLSAGQKMQAMDLIMKLCARRIKLKFDLGLYTERTFNESEKEDEDLGKTQRIIKECAKKYLPI